MTNTKFKTKWEHEEEDHRRYLKHQEAARARRIAKQMAEGWKCTFANCGMKFETQMERQAHTEKHNQECREKMICSQPSCGKQVCSFGCFGCDCDKHCSILVQEPEAISRPYN